MPWMPIRRRWFAVAMLGAGAIPLPAVPGGPESLEEAAPPTVVGGHETAVTRRHPGATFTARDSLAPGHDDDPGARDCLEGLLWEPGAFTVRLTTARDGHGDFTVRFPSPQPGGIHENDDVSLEWYLARDTDGAPLADDVAAPACVVVHESGSSMPFGRMIARGLAARGVQACMIHLPFYGLRRPTTGRPGPDVTFRALRQGVADVRRARDAVAVLPGVDERRIGLQGTSLGGFVTATAGAIDGGFSQVFILLAGGDIAGVIANGRRDAAALREQLAAAGLSDADVRAAVASVEPLRLAHRLDPARTWLYSALHDDVVPPRHAQLLAEAARLEEEHHVQLHANHYTGIVYLPLVLTQMRNRVADGPRSEGDPVQPEGVSGPLDGTAVPASRDPSEP